MTTDLLAKLETAVRTKAREGGINGYAATSQMVPGIGQIYCKSVPGAGVSTRRGHYLSIRWSLDGSAISRAKLAEKLTTNA